MNRRLRSVLTSSFLLSMIASAGNAAQSVTDVAKVIARRHAAEAVKLGDERSSAMTVPGALAACTPKSISTPTTVQGFLTSSSCYDAVINGYEDIYTFTGVAGQTITVDYSSTAYETFVYFEGLVSYINGTIQTTPLTTGTSRSKFTYTFATTRTYTLETESLFGPGDGFAYTGPYTLAITTSGGSASCTQTSTTMCLNSDRFAVSATWRTTDGNTGNGQAVRLTSDSGYFTFFSASNVEVVIKVLNGCGLNSRYWIFAGGLTDVNVTLTVRDTKTGAVKAYVNPIGTAFQPIQDTAAMGVCP